VTGRDHLGDPISPSYRSSLLGSKPSPDGKLAVMQFVSLAGRLAFWAAVLVAIFG
jgi:hypothetical protein